MAKTPTADYFYDDILYTQFAFTICPLKPHLKEFIFQIAKSFLVGDVE